MACFPACSIARSSASVVEVMTIDCLQNTQLISPPYNLNTYPSSDHLLGLFAKEASAKLSKISIRETHSSSLLKVIICYILNYKVPCTI